MTAVEKQRLGQTTLMRRGSFGPAHLLIFCDATVLCVAPTGPDRRGKMCGAVRQSRRLSFLLREAAQGDMRDVVVAGNAPCRRTFFSTSTRHRTVNSSRANLSGEGRPLRSNPR